jgi:hypothetical protein
VSRTREIWDDHFSGIELLTVGIDTRSNSLKAEVEASNVPTVSSAIPALAADIGIPVSVLAGVRETAAACTESSRQDACKRCRAGEAATRAERLSEARRRPRHEPQRIRAASRRFKAP